MFWFWLAANVFHKPVEWCLNNVDSSEATEWMAYFDIKTGKVKAAPPPQPVSHIEAIFKTWVRASNAKRNQS